MPVPDDRNILHIGPLQRAGGAEVTHAMADAVRQRIRDAGGKLRVWAVLREDVYETRFGDGFFLHVAGIALASEDAHALAERAGDSEWIKWHVRDYRLGLAAEQPAFLQSWSQEEEFRINDFVEILASLAPGRNASKLCTGTGRWCQGPFVFLPTR